MSFISNPKFTKKKKKNYYSQKIAIPLFQILYIFENIGTISTYLFTFKL